MITYTRDANKIETEYDPSDGFEGAVALAMSLLFRIYELEVFPGEDTANLGTETIEQILEVRTQLEAMILSQSGLAPVHYRLETHPDGEGLTVDLINVLHPEGREVLAMELAFDFFFLLLTVLLSIRQAVPDPQTFYEICQLMDRQAYQEAQAIKNSPQPSSPQIC